MIVLKADKELNLTFQKLIKMMDVPVEWNGMFFVIGDYLILQGSVRSLFFNFDTKLVVTNIIELKAEEQTIVVREAAGTSYTNTVSQRFMMSNKSGFVKSIAQILLR